MRFTNIKKRDGRSVDFDATKITRAIAKAGQATGEFGDKEALFLTMKTLDRAELLEPGDTLEVEKVQDIVECVLLDSPYRDTAKAYILYREQRAQMRSITAKAHVDLIDGYLQKMDWRVRGKINIGFSLQGPNKLIYSAVTSIH